MGRKNGKNPAGQGRGPAEPRRPAAGKPMEDVDLRVQLPYFAARLGVFAVLTVVLLVVGVAPLLAVLVGLAVAGFLTWPLGRMQRRAAARATARRAETEGRSGS